MYNIIFFLSRSFLLNISIDVIIITDLIITLLLFALFPPKMKYNAFYKLAHYNI